MEEANINVEQNEEINSEDALKEVVNEQFEKIRTQALLLGAQSMCKVILDKIIEVEAKPGRRSLNDYRRLIKDIRSFCTIGISRTVNPDGTTAPKEQIETVQN